MFQTWPVKMSRMEPSSTPNWLVRKDRDHGEHDSRQEAEHGDGLENIQQRNHDDSGAPGAGSDVAVSESKDQAQCISNADARERIQSVKREGAGILRNLDVGMDGAEPGTADRVDAKIAAQTNRKTAMSIRNAQLQREPAGRVTVGGSGVAAWAVERVRSARGVRPQ